MTDEARPRGSDSGAGRFTRTQIVLHWLVAALVTMQLFFNDAIQADFDRSMTGAGLDWPSPLGWLHIAGGTAILLLALWRLALRFTIGAPEAAMPAPRVAVWAGTAAHLALYGFLVMVPVTGALALLGQSDLAGEAHELLQWLMVPLLLAHAAGALIEHAFFENATLTRMLDIGGDDDLDAAGGPDGAAAGTPDGRADQGARSGSRPRP